MAAGSASQLCRNAEIESFHIHARNLIEFFKDDKQCAIDPRTFTLDNFRIQGNFIPTKLESKISQQIVHLSHERTDVEADKLSDSERDRTLQHIEGQIERFEKALRSEWRPIWRAGLSKMNFEEPSQAFHYVATRHTGPTELDILPNFIRGATNSPGQICTTGTENQNDQTGPKREEEAN